MMALGWLLSSIGNLRKVTHDRWFGVLITLSPSSEIKLGMVWI